MRQNLDLSEINRSPKDYNLKLPNVEDSKSLLTLESKVVSNAFIPYQKKMTFSRLDNISELDHGAKQLNGDRSEKKQGFDFAPKITQDSRLNRTSSQTNIFKSKTVDTNIGGSGLKTKSQTMPPSPKNQHLGLGPFKIPDLSIGAEELEPKAIEAQSPKVSSQIKQHYALVSFEKPKVNFENENQKSDFEDVSHKHYVREFEIDPDQPQQISIDHPEKNMPCSPQLQTERSIAMDRSANIQLSPPTTEHKKQLGAYIDLLQEKSRLNREQSQKNIAEDPELILEQYRLDTDLE